MNIGDKRIRRNIMKKLLPDTCTCETFQQIEGCDHIAKKVLKEVGWFNPKVFDTELLEEYITYEKRR